VIETGKKSDDAIYLHSIELNDKPQQSVMIPFSEVVDGGRLVLELSEQPNENIK
jgi:putative alpha-1,2-mannosidase